MVQRIPARLENGHVVPEAPLPEKVRSVSILVETEDARPDRTTSTLEKMTGIIRDPGDWKADYTQYLEEKYK